MKQILLFISLTLFILSCNNSDQVKKQAYNWPQGVAAPVAEKHPFSMTAHGDTRVDDYYWMNAYFKKTADSSKAVSYLEEENKYLDTMMSGYRGFRDKLFDEMKGRIKENDASVPYKDNGYWYYDRYEEGKQYAVSCRKKESLDAPEEILHDANKAAVGTTYYAATGLQVTDDNQWMAIGEDVVSRRLYTLRIKNLKTGEYLPESIINTEGGNYAWASDNKTLFYIRKDVTTLLGYQVWRHVAGTDPATDVKVFEEKDNRHYIGVGKTKSRKFIVIASELSEQESEFQILDAATPAAAFKIFQPRVMGLVYDIDHYNDKFYIRTNLDAPNFRLMECPLDKTSKESWTEVIPHRKDVYLANVSLFANHLVITERKDALVQVRIINQKDKSEHYIAFDEPAYLASLSNNPDFNTNVLRFNYTSMITPGSVYDYNMDTKEKVLKKQQEIVGGYNKADYVTERAWATARDGVKVPVSIVYKKGLVKDGSNPLLLYAYGSYGYTSDPSFGRNQLSLLNRGFVYVIAHIRGGQEMGRQWYEDGKMMHKKNTFYDFIDCAEFLIKEKYTSK